MGFKPPAYTQTPNEIFDEWLPKLKLVELRVLMVIIRKTFGWHKIKDRISLTQLSDLTGSDKKNVIESVKVLVELGLIVKTVEGDPGYQRTFYELKIDENSNNSTQSEIATPPGGVITTPPGGQETPTKETLTKEKKKEREAPPSPFAADAASLTEYFIFLIRQIDEEFKCNEEKWTEEFEKLLRIDKRDVEEVKQLLQWASNHKWWKIGCKCPTTLRIKYNDMRLEMKVQSNQSKEDDNFRLNKEFAAKFYEANEDDMPEMKRYASCIVNLETSKDASFTLPHETFKRLLFSIFGGDYEQQ